MTDTKSTDTPQAIEAIGHSDWERIVLGRNGIVGTLRIVIYIAAFSVVFGTVFYLAQ